MSLFKRQDREATGAAAAGFALIAMVFGARCRLDRRACRPQKDGRAGGDGQVALSEFAITPSSISVPLDGKLVITSSRASSHNFNIEGTKIKTTDLQAGTSTTVDLQGVKAGSYSACCAIAGHRPAGMQEPS
jgi:hypothetical protein